MCLHQDRNGLRDGQPQFWRNLGFGRCLWRGGLAGNTQVRPCISSGALPVLGGHAPSSAAAFWKIRKRDLDRVEAPPAARSFARVATDCHTSSPRRWDVRRDTRWQTDSGTTSCVHHACLREDASRASLAQSLTTRLLARIVGETRREALRQFLRAHCPSMRLHRRSLQWRSNTSGWISSFYKDVFDE
jgi:hypothetical protein